MALTDVNLNTTFNPEFDLATDDEALLGRLSDVAAVIDPVPCSVHALVRAAFAATRAPAFTPDSPRR